MKKTIKQWALRLTATGLFLVAVLVVIVLNPTLTYAHQTGYNNYQIFHDKPISPVLLLRLDSVTQLLKTSELYNPALKFTICLDDQSTYPALMEKVRGPAFGWGFHDIVVLRGNTNYAAGFVERNGYRWNLTKLLAHEAMHCLQFNKFGWWRSNPIAGWPNWKWEGYPEYVARLQSTSLVTNIDRLAMARETEPIAWEINLSDGTMVPRSYYEDALLVQFCLEVKKIGYEQLLQDANLESEVREEMMAWYQTRLLFED